MSERDHYPAGVPCWVETLQPDDAAARAFYGALFDWEFEGPGPIPGDPPADYWVARVRGRDVAGVGGTPSGVEIPVAWNTHVSVASADAAADAVLKAGGSVIADPFDAPPAGRLAVISDPAGAVLCLWESGERQGAQVINEPRAWSMSALQTPDPEGSKRFYGEVFGWQPEPFGPELTLWRLPGYVGGEPQQPVPRDVVGGMLVNRDGPPHWRVDFWVDDTDAASAAAGRLGGEVVVGPFDTPGFRSAVIADPQGATFSINQLLLGPEAG
jgi:hypothetical protein